MNIAIVTPEFVSESNFDGGLANYVYKLAKWLVNNNHLVTVFLIAKKNETIQFDGITIMKVAVPDVKWQYKYKFERFKILFLMNKKKYYRIEFETNSKYINNAIKKQQQLFDIIHYPHISGLALDCPKNIPAIVRLSSSTKLCQEFGGYGNSNLSALMQEEIETKAMKKANTVFGPSKMVAKLVEKDIHKKIKILETPYVKPNVALDDSIYKTTLNDKKYLLFFGSIGLIKGIGTIAQIIDEVLEQHTHLYFVFVGKKLNNQVENVSIWEYLITKAKKHHQRIIHFEPLKHAQLFPIIQHAECVVLPSRIDNFPNTCIEAMANSKIVIGTIGNGFDQLIEDGKSGFVIPVDDNRALLKTITTVLNLSAEEKLKIEQAAKSRTDLLHPDIVLNELVDLYKQTIKNFKN